MLRHTSTVLATACFAVLAFAAPAQAQRAPITYAGQNGGGAAAVTETAALGANGLAGGGDSSYGYGSSQHRRSGAVIDLRRTGARRTTPVVFEQPVAHQDEEESDTGPVSLAPTAAVQEPAAATSAASEQGPQPWLERERVGPPYEANGRWYVPTPEPGYQQSGTASWYGPQFHGQRTASGEVFDQDALTAAHPTLPIPSLVQVTNLENGREVIVRVNDRGPFTGDRLIDLSRGAAQVLDFEQQGHARVNVRYLGPAPRRVNADGAPAPESNHAPASAPVVQQAEQGTSALLPPAAEPGPSLAGAPVEERPVLSSGPPMAVGTFFVQVGAYSDPVNARRVRDAVAAAGPVVVDTRTTASGGELFRVRVGPWPTREEAETAQSALSRMGYADSVVASR